MEGGHGGGGNGGHGGSGYGHCGGGGHDGGGGSHCGGGGGRGNLSCALASTTWRWAPTDSWHPAPEKPLYGIHSDASLRAPHISSSIFALCLLHSAFYSFLSLSIQADTICMALPCIYLRFFRLFDL